MCRRRRRRRLTSLMAMIWPLAFFTFLSFRRKYLQPRRWAVRMLLLLLGRSAGGKPVPRPLPLATAAPDR